MRIIGSDYDGTLTAGGIDDRKLAAIAAWQKAGNCFALVTGRAMASMQDIRNEHQLNIDYYLCCNGGVLLDRNCNLLEHTLLPMDLSLLLDHVTALGAKYCYVAAVIGSYRVRLSGPKEYAFEVFREELPPITDFHGVSFRMETLEEVVSSITQLSNDFSEFLTPLRNNLNIDIVPKGVCKSAGLLRLAARLGCSSEDIIAVGDNINDLDMLNAFYSYAVASGVEEAKQAADHVTKGITELIETELSISIP